MAWTSPTTRTTGDLITAAIWNTDLVDNLSETTPAKVTTKGDIVVATAANAVSRLAVGSDGQQIVADAAEATGVKWADPGGIWTLISTFSDTNTGSAIAFDTGTISPTYDLYFVTGVLLNHNTLPLVNGVYCIVNGDVSANYAYLSLDTGGTNYTTGGTSWGLCFMYDDGASTNSVSFAYYVRGGNLASSPTERYPTIHGTSSSYITATYGPTVSGDLRVDIATVSRIQIGSTAVATGSAKVFGVIL
jgi:hypothetical protein